MSLIFYKYHLPFSAPLVTTKTTFTHREGYILEYRSNDFCCYGETAPLPGFSNENLEDVKYQIFQKKEVLDSVLADKNPVGLLNNLYNESAITPSLQFGLDSLAYQIEAFRAGLSLQNFLSNNALQEIPVNGLLSLRADKMLTEAKKLVSEGFRTIKYKVGLNFNQEQKNLEQIRTELPDISIRIDANQAWSFETALANLSKIEHLDIEYCEEPLKNPEPDEYQKLCSKTSIPLALDESIIRQKEWKSLLPFVNVLILKPMTLGSFSNFFVTKRLADTHDNKVVVTSSLESGVGRAITAVLASGTGSAKLAHGLNTGAFLEDDIFPDDVNIKNGLYHLKCYPKTISIQTEKLRDISTAIIK